MTSQVQAFSEAEAELMFVRLQWSDMLGHEYPMMSPQESVIKVPGTLVADARSLYDIVIKGDMNSSGLGLRDSALEVLSILQRLKMRDATVLWGGA